MTKEERRRQMIIALRLIKEVGEDIQIEAFAEAGHSFQMSGYRLWTEAGLRYLGVEESRIIPIVMACNLPE